MSGNDWNRLGRDVKDIVQNAIDTGDFGALNRMMAAFAAESEEVKDSIDNIKDAMGAIDIAVEE